MKRQVSLVFAFVLLLLSAGVAYAHASLVAADPRPNSVLPLAPARVTLTFDEEVDPNLSEIQILDHSSARVDNDDLKLAAGSNRQLYVTLKPLPDGSYTVAWKALSATDGHITLGNYVFSVGSTAAPAAPNAAAPQVATEADPLALVSRWMVLLTLLVLVGGFLFRGLLIEPSPLAALDPRASGRAKRAWRQLVLVAFYVALLGSIAGLLVQASTIFETPVMNLISTSAVTRTLFETRFGQLWLIRVALLLLTGAVLFIPWRIGRFVGPLIGLALLLTISLGSHAAADGGLFSLPLIADWLHLSAVSLWVGGLFYFLTILLAVWRRFDAGARTRWLAWMIPQFTRIALPATAVIALTGLYNSLLEVPSLDALVQTLYGDALAVKVSLFGVMVALGAVNLLLLTPRFRRAAGQAEPAARLASHFRLTVAAEVFLGAAAIFLAGMLTIEPPARASVQMAHASETWVGQGALLVDQAAPDVQVALTLKPTLEDPSEFGISLSDPRTNKPVADVLRVIVQFTMLDRDLGVNQQIAQEEEGSYSVRGNYISVAGMWRIHITVRRKGVEDVAVDFPVYSGPLTPTAAPGDSTARQALSSSETVMNQLKSLRSRQALNDGSNGVVITHYDFRAPDAMLFQVQGQSESIALGAVQYYQDSAGRWTARQRVSPLVFPQFDVAAQALNVHLSRAETVNGVATRIVRYALPDATGGSTEFAQWISVQDHRLVQLAMVAPSHFMMQTYFDFDSPQIVISPPAGVATPTAEPVASAEREGNTLYTQYCSTCHGETGHGDGPGGKRLPVQPFDLTTHVLLHDEQYLDAVISNGRGYMPAFKNTLSVDQISALIAYIRLLAIEAQQGGQPGATPQAGFTPQP